jgi:hypothetical protein
VVHSHISHSLCQQTSRLVVIVVVVIDSAVWRGVVDIWRVVTTERMGVEWLCWFDRYAYCQVVTRGFVGGILKYGVTTVCCCCEGWCSV